MTTDFSEESGRALPYAAEFSARCGGQVILLNVVEPPPRLIGVETLSLLQSGDFEVGRAHQALEAMAARELKARRPVGTRVRTGRPCLEIIKAAQELGAQLLIMATHGYSGLKHTFLGSITERVIRHAPCPVLAVRGSREKPPGRRDRPILQQIVLATDFSKNSMTAFPLAWFLANQFDARLSLINVVQRFRIDAIRGLELPRKSSTELMKRARVRLTEIAASFKTHHGQKAGIEVRYGEPFSEITLVAKALDASLVVLATHGYTGLKHIHLGSVAERVVRHACCPVLVVPH